MRSHVPLCVLPPCASSLPLGGPHQRPDVIPGQPLQPACVILHASGPTARSFLSPLQSSRCGRPYLFYPAASALCPVPLRSAFPPRDSSTVPYAPLWQSGATNGHQVALGHHMPTGSGPPPLPCLPDLPLPVEHTHIAVSCHFASSPPADCPHKTKRKESRGFPSSCQRDGHRASQILS